VTEITFRKPLGGRIFFVVDFYIGLSGAIVFRVIRQQEEGINVRTDTNEYFLRCASAVYFTNNFFTEVLLNNCNNLLSIF
jgi:hypothetical protein